MNTLCSRPMPRPGPALQGTVTTEIIKSWQRCLSSYNLDPSQRWKAEVLSGAELRHVSHRSAALLGTAMPEMRRLFRLVQGLDLMVLLADPDATILARNIDDAHLPLCTRLALREGAIWDERIAGTNGIGTAVQDCCAIFLGEGEHWRFCFSLLASYAVPVFNAVGQVAGVINLAAFNGPATAGVAPLVLDTLQQSGRRIEEQLFRDYHMGERILSLGPAEGCSASLVAINRDGEVTGATRGARMLTGWTDDMIRTHPNLLGTLAVEDRISFRRAEENVIRSALALAHGNVAATARNLGIGRATLYRKMKMLGLR
ncbi:Fis family transcriptional regulator [Komagataeibacter rhaeticus]|uniref:Fis family transcriptional regulator n=2 Tax=Komagataeibacter rhaeticus TaxID=215221 RepID=A0A181C9H3_9PROT|nr:Fis family transcriptional regulator [Komagataeibacter xylinus]KDU94718.1 Fis family transcriptional regulator [Komagataeibacter rhaeticus AF1]MBL7240696.1 Fis family transcriptional regulator [Komagataeibacter rhaeticus]PYD52889.1 Fis family transcriptional regulator [Komagataeibacter rhaeticus]QIP35053.1 Fis family transcriptional regulator [Komagataeibacter rhaeticus]